MPFDSRKQQKWYHATDQTYWDDKPHSARLVKKGGSKSEEGEDPEFKDLTTTAGGDLDPQNKNLQTTQGSMKESLEFEGKEYKLSPEGHIPEDDDLEYDDKIYTEVTEEEKEFKRGEQASEYSYKEMRESLLKNDVKQILTKAVEEFKEDVVDFTQNKDDVNKQWEFWQVDMETHKKVDDTIKIVKAEHYGQAIDDYIANWNTTHEDKTVGYPNVQGKLYNEATEEFKEEEHPRKGGKFTSKGGGSDGKAEKPTTGGSDEDVWNKANDEIKHIAVGNAMAGVGTGIPDKWETGKGEFKVPSWNEMTKKQQKLLSKQLKKDLGDDFYKGVGEDSTPEGITDKEQEKAKPKEDKPKEKRFTMSSYNRNETRNAHGANALHLVEQYGTPEELEEMKGIMKRHKEQGSIGGDDYKRRYEISNKYYEQLVKESGESFADEEGIGSVSGPPADSTMRVMSDKVHVRPEGKFVDENLTEDNLTDDTLTDTVLGEESKIEFEGENYVLSPKGYNPTDKDLIFEGRIYKATENGIGNCEFCAGKGQITVENLGIKDCPDCDGTGEVQQPDPMQDPMQPQVPDVTGQMGQMGQMEQPLEPTPPDQPTQPSQIPQQPIPNEQPAPPQQAPEEKKEKPNFGEVKKKSSEVKLKFGEANYFFDLYKKKLQEYQDSGRGSPNFTFNDFLKETNEEYLIDAYREGLMKGEEAKTKPIACEKSMKQFRGYIAKEIEVLKKKAKANEAISVMYGLPTIEKQGKKIKGILAYAGVSLNDRIYLPEELAKGHGLTLPLLLNHSNIAGAEEELDRLDDDMVSHLEDERDYKIGEVTLDWDQEKLTLFYEGIIDHPFFQKEVDDADMAVSLGIYYDSDSPVVCDDNCYTIIKGAEFREVSLVYHPGFPIATIEAVEHELKEEIMKKQKAKEDHLEKLDQLKKNEEQEQAQGEDETEDIKLIDNITKDIKEDSDTVDKILNEKLNEKLGEENEEDIIITDDPQTLDLVTQVPAEDWNAGAISTEANFSIKGINGFTISNSNGVTRYKLDPSNGYENNWLHVNVNQEGAKLYGEEFQLQPKMTTPPELTKEIESKPDIEFTESDADAFKKK